MYCPKCNRQYGPSETSCVVCGAPFRKRALEKKRATSPSPSQPERRPMTALFCDLVNSTGLSVQLDPEELMGVLDAFLGRCDQIITDHGGYLARFVGDAVLAYFGYPRANEDDAANAVSAGLAILD